jgi:hypothetical protein
MVNKQERERMTAVEWLWNEIDNLIPYQDINKAQQFNGLLEQAKEMEKQQMKDAVIYGLDEDGHTGDWKISVAENYYIKTYTK